MSDVYKAPLCDVETAELKGYVHLQNLFVDNSGLGLDSEPALTQSRFESELKSILRAKNNGTVYASIVDAGPFQVYVGLFDKGGKKRAKNVGTATLKIETENGFKIRYHATDVIEYKDNEIILNNGGYYTVTTKKRINEYLPHNLYVEQKNFEWFLVDREKNTRVPFENGMTVKIN